MQTPDWCLHSYTSRCIPQSGILPARRYSLCCVKPCNLIYAPFRVANSWENLLFVGRHDELRRIPPFCRAVFELRVLCLFHLSRFCPYIGICSAFCLTRRHAELGDAHRHQKSIDTRFGVPMLFLVTRGRIELPFQP